MRENGSLPTATAIPLGFIVNELITNAVNYGEGRIAVSWNFHSGKGCVPAASNGGRALPEDLIRLPQRGWGRESFGPLSVKLEATFVLVREKAIEARSLLFTSRDAIAERRDSERPPLEMRSYFAQFP